ncbi:hypothetical protein HPB50_029460 [Hyalomma asiaticum]|nr:hypothetical protein HPB50_029460 [Hyalomma asiaticum]
MGAVSVFLRHLCRFSSRLLKDALIRLTQDNEALNHRFDALTQGFTDRYNDLEFQLNSLSSRLPNRDLAPSRRKKPKATDGQGSPAIPVADHDPLPGATGTAEALARSVMLSTNCFLALRDLTSLPCTQPTHPPRLYCYYAQIPYTLSANRQAGLRERNTLRLTQAYVISRTTYALPYLPLQKKERDQINALLRSCTKTALRLPPSTSNERLLKLGEIERPSQAEERLLSLRDIIAYYRDQRRVYAAPASSRTVTQAAHWRRLQTRTAPYPILLNAQYPDQFPSSCKLCGEPGDFMHILLTCPTFPHPPSPAVAVSYWESTMNSTSAFDQRKVISCAMKRIALQGLSSVFSAEPWSFLMRHCDYPKLQISC